MNRTKYNYPTSFVGTIILSVLKFFTIDKLKGLLLIFF